MATHFGILAWEIPWTEEPGRLQSSGSQRVGHNCSTEQQQCIQNNCTLTYKHSLVAQMVKNLPSLQETWIQSLGQEDPLEKEMATHFGILAWEIPWTEEPGWATVHEASKSQTSLSN